MLKKSEGRYEEGVAQGSLMFWGGIVVTGRVALMSGMGVGERPSVTDVTRGTSNRRVCARMEGHACMHGTQSHGGRERDTHNTTEQCGGERHVEES